MNKLMPVILMLGLVVSPLRRVVLAQQQLTNLGVEKIKTEIVRRLRDKKTEVTVRLRNGSELKGKITAAAENRFILKTTSNGTQRDLSYAEVMRVKGRGLSKGAKFGILTAIVAGAVIIGALVSMKNIEPFKNGVLR